MPCRAASPERGWTNPAWPAGIATARPVPIVRRSPGASAPPRCWTGRAPRRRGSRGGHPGVGVQPAHRDNQATVVHAVVGVAGRRSSRGSRAVTSTPSALVLAPVIGAPLAYSAESSAPASCGHQQPDVDVAVGEELGHRGASARPGSRRCGPRSAPRRGSGSQPPAADRVDQRRSCSARACCGSSSAPISSSTRVARRPAGGQLLLAGRGVGDQQDQVAGQRLLERRREGLDQLVRQLADEPDGVGHQVCAALLVGTRGWSGRASRTGGRRRSRRRR